MTDNSDWQDPMLKSSKLSAHEKFKQYLADIFRSWWKPLFNRSSTSQTQKYNVVTSQPTTQTTPNMLPCLTNSVWFGQHFHSNGWILRMLIACDRVDSSQYTKCYGGEFPVTSLLSVHTEFGIIECTQFGIAGYIKRWVSEYIRTNLWN